MAEQKVKVDANLGLGSVWLAGWLFTIGYVGLDFLKGLLAIFLWPYFLGVQFAPAELPMVEPAQIERAAD
jgi:hypothetical protein